jgi:hypothetical protein
MTRTLAQYIAQGYMTDGTSPNQALEQASKLTLDEVEAPLLGAAADKPKENKEGSYERFMGTLGASGGRRPGQ